MSDSVFTCRLCGECCFGRGGVGLNDVEARRVADFLGLTVPRFQAEYLSGEAQPWDIRVGADGYCLFHQAEGSCLIHPVKPQVCRRWPFLPGLLAVESAYWEARSACPGLSGSGNWSDFKLAACLREL